MLLTLLLLTLAAPGIPPAPGSAPGSASSRSPQSTTAPAPETQPPVTTATKKPMALTITARVANVTDRRSQRSSILSGCTVDLIFGGPATQNAMAVEEIVLTQVIDDTGVNLIDKPLVRNPNLGDDDPGSPMRMPLRLKNPARHAKKIAHLEGLVRLAMPSEAGVGLVSLENFTATPGKLLADDELVNRQVKLCYLTPQMLRDATVETLAIPILPEELAAIRPLIDRSNKDITLIPILIHDPDKQIVKMQMLTNLGQPSPAMGKLRKISFASITLFLSLRGEPSEPTLEIHLKSDKTAVTVPFKVSNIPLP